MDFPMIEVKLADGSPYFLKAQALLGLGPAKTKGQSEMLLLGGLRLYVLNSVEEVRSLIARA